MNKRIVAVAVLVLALAPAAWAGMVFTSVTKMEGGKGTPAQANTVKGYVDGELARIEFQDSNNPIMEKGTYLITTDGGKEVYLVNPKKKTYSKLDVEGMMGFAGGAMKMMNMKFSDPKVEKLGEGPGAIVAGMPTIHYTFRTTYSMSMSFMGMKKATRIVQEEEIWSAPKLVEAALGIWLRKSPPKFGDENLDKLVRAEMDKVEGFPLKRKTVQTTTDEKGRSETTTTMMEVTSLEVTSVPGSLFEIPSGYQEAPLLMPGMEGGEGEENPFAKLMGGKK